MISELIALFRFPEPETPTRFSAEDEKLALAALMVRAARVDGEYLPHEQHVIDLVLQERFALAAPDSVRIRREAEELEAQAPDTVRFTRVIKRTVPYEERKAIVEALWKVVLADDTRDAEENGFLRLVTHLVGVADRDSGLARQRAEREREREIPNRVNES